MNRISKMCVLLAFLTGMLCACGSGEEEEKPQEENKVAILLPSIFLIPRISEDLRYLSEALTVKNISHQSSVASGAEQQVEQLKKMLKEGCKYIIITAIDYRLINESHLLEQYPDVTVICHDRLILDNNNVDYYSSCDGEEVGEMQADYLLDYLPAYLLLYEQSPTIEMLAGPSSDDNSYRFYRGAYNKLKPYIDNGQLIVKSGLVNFEDVAISDWSIKAATDNFRERLKKYYPDSQPDFILSPNDESAIGVVDALEAHNPSIVDYPIITGQDNILQIRSYLQKGKVAMTINKNLQNMAENSVSIVDALIKGTKPSVTSTVNNGAIDVPFIKTSLQLVDRYSLPEDNQ